MPRPTRRTFGAAVALTAAAYSRVLGANDKVRLGVIGVGNRGDQLLDAFTVNLDCEIVALCDVYEPYLPAANKKVGGAATVFKEYRKLLDEKSIDAAVIATPDHWHALQFVDACRAGKDVYVEKPLSLTIGEGRRMCQVAAETKRVTQVGLHRRSTPYVQEAVKMIRDGFIGQVTLAKSYMHRNETPMGIGNPADGDPPPGLDWDTWLGPAPKAAFNANKCLYKFRWFSNYSGGQLTNMGTHYLDIIQWALGQDAPKGVDCLGGKYAVTDNRDIPDTMEAVWEYDNCLATFTQVNANGAAANLRGWNMEFRGTLGTMLISDGDQGYEIIPEKMRLEEIPALSPTARESNTRQGRAVKATQVHPAKKGPSDTASHARNFLDCVKSRAVTNCPVEVGHRSTTATLLAKLALERKRYLAWDAKAERVTNDEDANKLLTYEYRNPWVLG
ncbi:Gfo/Idh/MocA family protein [Limnoglobus roseus]|uniref:Putative Rossmann-fold-type glycoside hydrolase n=1 Tax=Limnoglobus roseus TaxID=2598579 RepID=A0A5C1ASG2_9BACT|nr:Gfo/Idh/MocA family oxidoreductase [Limnoglobus roseus]QEL20976.1 putative Rossmann-fold-type glycoside hydrolase [Limnoglobus roseus]